MKNSLTKEKNNVSSHHTSFEWHLVDAKGQILGRLASNIANKLLAKHRLDSAVNRPARVKIVVINTDEVALSGDKEKNKFYYHYTGYHGGLKQRSVSEQRKKDSRIIVRHAVAGMLPKNKLRSQRLVNLLLYRDANHPHSVQIK